MRNPKWHKDEIILALDLYFNTDRGSIDKSNPKIIQLSETLNRLPIFDVRPDAARFRNPNGVTLKLSNFLAIDPKYVGKGMKSYSSLDKKLFEQYSKDPQLLHALANEIRKVSADPKLSLQIYHVEEDEQTLNDSVMEGQVLYKLHKVRERDTAIVKAKKSDALSRFGYLACEACIFDFKKTYGDLGNGYIECHHKTPLSMFKSESRTSLDDLGLVCANCHRMLHRSNNHLSIEDLRTKITYRS